MTEREGVVRYRCEHQEGPAPAATDLAALDAWRTVLHRLRLLGQSNDRYEGYGYGNVSIRAGDGFLISGTQSGRPERLGPGGYARVTRAAVEANAIRSEGPVRPSSEALTHAACYAADPAVGAVLHVHSPELWRNAGALQLPITPADVPYGTPAMAEAVADALAQADGPRLVAMGGHEDGILAVGETPAAAGRALVDALARALMLDA